MGCRAAGDKWALTETDTDSELGAASPEGDARRAAQELEQKTVLQFGLPSHISSGQGPHFTDYNI